MVNEIHLDQTPIKVYEYKDERENGLHRLTVSFKVTSEEYHDIAVLLYQETFDIHVPEQGLNFRGRITNYSTSITNLYEKGNVGDYQVTFSEI